MSDAELLARTREIRDGLLKRASTMREMGIEVDAFLVECERLIAAKEGRSDEWVDLVDFSARMDAFHQELEQFHHLERQAERAKAIGGIPGMLDALEQFAQRLRKGGNARAAEQLESLVATARERLARGEVPQEQMEDIQLLMTAEAAEAGRRQLFRNATIALYWESRPPEWWAKLPPEQRAKTEAALALWRRGREKLLGELPIADRRRLEALRPEDFDHPERLKP